MARFFFSRGTAIHLVLDQTVDLDVHGCDLMIRCRRSPERLAWNIELNSATSTWRNSHSERYRG